MRSAVAVRVDAKGRLTVPREIREELGIEPGTTLFMELEGSVLRFAKATNPFEGLAEEAVGEYRSGKTTELLEFAREMGVDLSKSSIKFTYHAGEPGPTALPGMR